MMTAAPDPLGMPPATDVVSGENADDPMYVPVIKRGLSVAGTRITLYDVMDYVTQNWSPELIQYWFNLTDNQIADIMDYIKKTAQSLKPNISLSYSRQKTFGNIGKSEIRRDLPELQPCLTNREKRNSGPDWKPRKQDWKRNAGNLG